MAFSTRIVALALITAGAVGAGTWATVWHFGRPARGPAAAPTETAKPTEAARRIKATLYYVSADGRRLAAAERDVLFAESASEQARRIMEAMLEPAPDGLASAIPAGTELRGLYVGGQGDAYVDFSGTLRTSHPGGTASELLTVYAIVSAITANLPAITSVQILIEGHEVDTLAGHVDLRRPLPHAPQWAEKGTT
ncbi:MAG: GerMN domain-containing protein [Vicinamibacterales bacterium]